MSILLLIEDDCTILENTAELLAMEGYSVITANNGITGFEKVLTTRPHLIICDVLMPQMDGLQLLAKLGLHPELKMIPFIFYSAKTEKKDIKKGLDAGAYDYITKPCEIEHLLAAVKKCIKEKSSN